MTTSSAEPLYEHTAVADHSDSNPRPRKPTSQSSQATLTAPGSATTCTYELEPIWSTKRYDRVTLVEPPYINKATLDPMTRSFTEGEESGDWTRLVHPEGALYWRSKCELHGKEMSVYTEAYLYDERIRKEVEHIRQMILSMVGPEINREHDEWELVLDLEQGDIVDPNRRRCGYYFVDHPNRTLFWVHKFDAWQLLLGLGVKTKRRIKQAIETYYWAHWEAFPDDRVVSEDLVKELIGIMIHAGVDEMTSNESTSIYHRDDLNMFISYVEQVRTVGGAGGYSACVVGRLMKFFAHGRYVNFFGQREARLSSHQSIFGDNNGKKRMGLFKILSFLLFFAPEVRLIALDNMYTDLILCQHKWIKFNLKMQKEWQDLIWIGTVLLTANVAFLAIPSVDTSSNNGSSQSGGGLVSYPRNPAQVTSFVSMIFTMGCMITGQLLLQHDVIQSQVSAEETDKRFHGYLRSYFGLGTLAIQFSLPHALLLWAIASFFVAFVFLAFVASEGIWQKYLPITVTVIVAYFVVWCSWTTWVKRADYVGSVLRSLKGSSTSSNDQYTPHPNKDLLERASGSDVRMTDVRVGS